MRILHRTAYTLSAGKCFIYNSRSTYLETGEKFILGMCVFECVCRLTISTSKQRQYAFDCKIVRKLSMNKFLATLPNQGKRTCSK